MSDIHVTRRHLLSVAHAKKIAQKSADDLAEEYDLKSEWDGDTLNFQRAGVTGSMKVTTSQIDLTVTLGLLFKPFKSKFENHITHRLDELLLAAAPGGKTVKVTAKGAKKSSGRRG